MQLSIIWNLDDIFIPTTGLTKYCIQNDFNEGLSLYEIINSFIPSNDPKNGILTYRTALGRRLTLRRSIPMNHWVVHYQSFKPDFHTYSVLYNSIGIRIIPVSIEEL